MPEGERGIIKAVQRLEFPLTTAEEGRMSRLFDKMTAKIIDRHQSEIETLCKAIIEKGHVPAELCIERKHSARNGDETSYRYECPKCHATASLTVTFDFMMPKFELKREGAALIVSCEEYSYEGKVCHIGMTENGTQFKVE